MELRVWQLNINAGYNEKIMEKCPTLFGYSKLISYIRNNQKSLAIEEAIDQAVKQCIHEGILEKFLKEHRAEVIKMSIYEYDEEKHMRALREEGREEGISLGINENKKETAQRMLRTGKLTMEEIAEYSGLNVEEVEELAGIVTA